MQIWEENMKRRKNAPTGIGTETGMFRAKNRPDDIFFFFFFFFFFKGILHRPFLDWLHPIRLLKNSQRIFGDTWFFFKNSKKKNFFKKTSPLKIELFLLIFFFLIFWKKNTKKDENKKNRFFRKKHFRSWKVGFGRKKIQFFFGTKINKKKTFSVKIFFKENGKYFCIYKKWFFDSISIL